MLLLAAGGALGGGGHQRAYVAQIQGDIDGSTVCEILRRLPSTASTPVFMLTAMSGEIPRCHGFESGATEFLYKPIQTRDLLERVRGGAAGETLDKRRACVA